MKGKANFEKVVINKFAHDVREKMMEQLRQRCRISENDAIIRKSGIVRNDLYMSSMKKVLEDAHNSMSRVVKSKFKKQEIEDL